MPARRGTSRGRPASRAGAGSHGVRLPDGGARPCGRSARPGATLVTGIVALGLGAVATALVARGTAAALATHGGLVAAERLHDDPADALDAIAARARYLVPRAGDLLAASDGTLALRPTVGIALLCERRADTLLLARGADGTPWASDWLRDPAAGDELRTAALVDSAAWAVPLRAVHPGSGPCAPGARAWRERVAWRAVVTDTGGRVAGLAVGEGVRILTRERYLAYAGAGGVRTLGLAPWDAEAGTWAAPQPVVAPLASEAQGGLVVGVRDAGGHGLAAGALEQARVLVVALRARGAAVADSVLVPFHGP